MNAVIDEIDQVRAGLIAKIQGEGDIRSRQAEAQHRRLELAEQLKEVTQKLNQQIRELSDIDYQCDMMLSSVERAKAELLRTSPEGRTIRGVLVEIRELQWGETADPAYPVPQLPLLQRKLELAIERDEQENIGVYQRQISDLSAKIEQRKAEVRQIWESLGCDPMSFPFS